MTIDRHRLQDIIDALKGGATLGDGERKYATHLLTMVSHLAFYDDDLERVFEYRVRKAGERNQRAVKDLALLGIAHRSGKGMPEAWKLIHAKRERTHMTKAAVDFVKAINGGSTNAAINEVAQILGRDPESVHSQYYRKPKPSKPKSESKG